jgi:membrane carboxypeptidase/penicillin-binding protein
MWASGFSIDTTTGHWIGYSSDRSIYAGGDVEVYSGCLILHVTNNLVDASAIVSNVSEIDFKEPVEYQLGEILAHEGTALPGVVNKIGAFAIASNPT